MTKPCIICVAITGSLPQKADTPAVPISISEQVESTQEAFEAGASIAHCHVRTDEGAPTSDPDRFARLQEGLKAHCPGMIIQFSTGGRSGAGQERGGMLPLRPDMASLTVGSNNFPARVYENAPQLVDWLASEIKKYDIKPEIEAFDLSHIFQAASMAADERLEGPLYVQFVMGVKNAMPADKPSFDFMVETLRRLAPDAEWCAAGIGPNQLVLNEWCIEAGGHCRTGLEDNIRLDRDTLAPSNAALVKRTVDLCAKFQRPVASPAEAREILGPAAVMITRHQIKPTLWGRGSSTNVQKVLWALHELDVDHAQVEVGGPFGGTDNAQFFALNPNRTVPVWQTDDLVLWESQAILRHLARKHGHLYGADERAMADVDRWLDWFALVFWPPVRLLFIDVYRDRSLALDDTRAQDALIKAQGAIQLVADQVAKDRYLTGPDFTIADIALAIGLNRARGLDFGITLPASLCDWHATQKARPGFAYATRGEPDMPGHQQAAE